ncbi:FkbM family methyltransferase [Mariniflexile sp. HNIBRBA6329]|uniref:FkbM family methyltransferase n=1 Tax=Mariniflexile sp. HNIBRBA6329 TaxID=3373088 RepID=UPI0037456B90
MSDFIKALDKKIIQSLKNNYGVENYDTYRFGTFPLNTNNNTSKEKKKWRDLGEPKKIIKELKKFIKKIIGYNLENKAYPTLGHNFVNPYLNEFENIWCHISKPDKKLLVSLIAYRVLGYKKVKLSRNNPEYWDAIKTATSLANSEDTIDPHFMHFILKKMDLKSIGLDISFYYTEKGLATTFIMEQYAYKLNDKSIVAAESGDTVLDIGACWGDTALYFAYKVGENGKVYSFEFIPDNLKLFNRNISLNPHFSSKIDLVPNPVSNNSGDLIYFKDHGPGSKVEFEFFEGHTGTASTISIDDFVKSHRLEKVDFIKMDIEGAEPLALEGAIETIKRFKPKLAIAIYHSMSDFVTIPNWILNLNLDYEIFIGHYTIHAEETICFAKPKNRS